MLLTDETQQESNMDTASTKLTGNDPMGTLNAYFETVRVADQNWASMKEQISILVAANQEMEGEYQAMKKENKGMKKEYQRMKEENMEMKTEFAQLKKYKREAETYTQTLETQVKEFRLENQVMKIQIDAKKQLIEQAQNELSAAPDMFCGATRMIAH